MLDTLVDRWRDEERSSSVGRRIELRRGTIRQRAGSIVAEKPREAPGVHGAAEQPAGGIIGARAGAFGRQTEQSPSSFLA